MPKYLFRLLNFGILLGTIPVMTIGIIAYYIASSDIENKVKEGNLQILLQTRLRVEQVMKTIEMSSIQYVNTPQVRRTEYETIDSEDFILIRDLTSGLYNLQTSINIRNAYLINLDKDWVVQSGERAYFDYFTRFELYNLFSKYAKNIETLEWVTPNYNPRAFADTEIPPQVTGEADKFRMVLKLPVFERSPEPSEMLIVEIDKSEFAKLLAQKNQFGEHYILDPNGNDLVSKDPEKYQEINKTIVDMLQKTGNDHGFFRSKLGDVGVGVTYLIAPRHKWIYVSVASLDELTKQSRTIALVTWIVCVVIFTIVSLLAYAWSRRMYSPILRLFNYTQHLATNANHNRSIDEFSLIEEQLETLFSTEKQLQQQLRGQFAHLKEFVLLKLFTGQISESDFIERAHVYGFPTHWRKFGVLTLQIDTLQGTHYQEHDRELLMFAINNIVTDLLPEDRLYCPILLDHISQVTLLGSDSTDPDEMKKWLHETAELIKSTVDEYLKIPISIGISRPFDKYREAVRAYGETLEALKCRISLGNGLVMHFEDIEHHQDNDAISYSHVKILEDQLIYALKTCDRERLEAAFREYIDALAENETNINEYPFLFVQLSSRIFQVVQEYSGSLPAVLGDYSTIDQLMKCNTREAITYFFYKQLFDPVLSFLSQQEDKQYFNIAKRMVNLIQERYDQELTLESCASMLNYHPGYLSRVFKKEYGVTFSDYLTEYRINMAKSMLEHSNMKISDIAEKLRYTHTSAFIRSFRKIVGITPGQYRSKTAKKASPDE